MYFLNEIRSARFQSEIYGVGLKSIKHVEMNVSKMIEIEGFHISTEQQCT